jgi:hypothetical protein
MSLWGCQVGSGFLSCANTMYSESERMLVGATIMAAIALASYLVIRLTSAR